MSDKRDQKRGLGRGLSALMADIAPTPPDALPAQRRADQYVPIESVVPNPDQPRRRFTEDQLRELAASIRDRGIIQPLIVRRHPRDLGVYQIVAGERRWRAAQLAQLHDVPVLVREFNDSEVLEVAIIENIQREDLNPIEEATAYRQLMERFGHTQEKVAEALGKSRSHIANMMRLLALPEEVLSMVRDGRLSAGHARAILSADDPLALARQVVAQNLSVRETEKLAKPAGGNRKTSGPRPKSTEKDADTRALEADLSASLGLQVSIDHQAGGESGIVTLHYASLDQLDELCRILSRVSG